MGLFVRNPEVQALAEQVAARLKVTKTEAIRRALQHELDRAAPSLVDRGRDYVRTLHRTARPAQGQPADQAWIDSLYGE